MAENSAPGSNTGNSPNISIWSTQNAKMDSSDPFLFTAAAPSSTSTTINNRNTRRRLIFSDCTKTVAALPTSPITSSTVCQIKKEHSYQKSGGNASGVVDLVTPALGSLSINQSVSGDQQSDLVTSGNQQSDLVTNESSIQLEASSDAKSSSNVLVAQEKKLRPPHGILSPPKFNPVFFSDKSSSSNGSVASCTTVKSSVAGSASHQSVSSNIDVFKDMTVQRTPGISSSGSSTQNTGPLAGSVLSWQTTSQSASSANLPVVTKQVSLVRSLLSTSGTEALRSEPLSTSSGIICRVEYPQPSTWTSSATIKSSFGPPSSLFSSGHSGFSAFGSGPSSFSLFGQTTSSNSNLFSPSIFATSSSENTTSCTSAYSLFPKSTAASIQSCNLKVRTQSTVPSSEHNVFEMPTSVCANSFSLFGQGTSLSCPSTTSSSAATFTFSPVTKSVFNLLNDSSVSTTKASASHPVDIPVSSANYCLFGNSSVISTTGYSLFGQNTVTSTISTLSFSLFGQTSVASSSFDFKMDKPVDSFLVSPSGSSSPGCNVFSQATPKIVMSTSSTKPAELGFAITTNAVGGLNLFSASTPAASDVPKRVVRKPVRKQSANSGISLSEGTIYKFVPLRGDDVTGHNGDNRPVVTYFQNISCMKEYSHKSFEELRLDDYCHMFVNVNKEGSVFNASGSNSVGKGHASSMGSVSSTTNNGQDKQVDDNPTMNTEQVQDIWKILECPVCLEVVLPPIMQCEQGHHICSSCRPIVPQCPLCKKRLTSTRNYVAESLVQKLPLPCKYRVEGCMTTCLHDKKQQHEQQCYFRPYNCPAQNCRMVVNPRTMINHFTIVHKDIDRQRDVFTQRERYERSWMGNKAVRFQMKAIEVLDWGIFIHKLEVMGDGKWCFMVQMVATFEKAKEFQYKVRVFDFEGKRKLSYSGPVQSLHVPGSEIIESCDCLIVANSVMDKLTAKSMLFHCSVIIHKVPQN